MPGCKEVLLFSNRLKALIFQGCSILYIRVAALVYANAAYWKEMVVDLHLMDGNYELKLFFGPYQTAIQPTV